MAVSKVVLQIDAGTAQFFLEMDKCEAKVRGLGAASTSNLRQATAVTKALESGLGDSNRAMTSLLVNTLGLGPALTAAFSVLGIVALGAQIIEVTKKVEEFFKKIDDGANKMQVAAAQLTQGLREEGNGLDVANDKLQNQIDKLNGRPENLLKLAIDEDIQAADQLGDHLLASLEKFGKFITDNGPKWYHSLIEFLGSTNIDLQSHVLQFQADQTKITGGRDELTDQIKANPKYDDTEKSRRVADINHQANVLLVAAYEKDALWVASKKLEIDSEIAADEKFVGSGLAMATNAAQLSDLKRQRNLLEIYGSSNTIAEANAKKEIRNEDTRSGLPAAEDNHLAIEAQKKADEAMAQLNKGADKIAEERERKGEQLGQEMAAQLAKGLEDEVRAQHASNMNYQLWALQRAESLKQLHEKMKGINADGSDDIAPHMMRDFEDIQTPMKYAAEIKDEEEYQKQLDKTVKYIEEIVKEENRRTLEEQKQILERRKMAEEQANRISEIGQQADKSTATRQAGAMEKVVSLSNASGEAKITAEYQIRVMLAERIHEIEQARIDAMAAGNAKDVAMAHEKADYAEANAKAEVDAELKLYELKVQHMKELQHAFDPLINALSDDLEKAMTGQKVNWGKSLQDAGHSMLQSGIHKGLEFGMDKLFGKSLKPIDQWSLKPHVWVDNPSGDGSQKPETGGAPNASRPGGGGASVSSPVNPLAELAKFAPLLGGAGGGGGGADPNSYHIGYGPNFGGGKAEGGDIDPGHSYLVGENAPEMFIPRSAGTITPLSKIDGGGTTYNVDARYSSLGVENRIRREIQAAHASAVATSVRANESRKDRTPQRKS